MPHRAGMRKNIVKHSQPPNVMRVERDENNLTVKISTTGRGFYPAEGEKHLSKRSFGGLELTREAVCSAENKHRTQPGTGTHI